MAEEADVSSLERFVKTRGVQLLGGFPNQRATAAHFFIGSVFTGLGVSLAVAAMSAHQQVLAFAALGPLMAGGINLLVFRMQRKKALQPSPLSPTMTPEARSMLSSLAWRYVWSKNPWVWGQQTYADPSDYAQFANFGGNRWAAIAQMNAQAGRDQRTVPSEVLEWLERAAFQYNRVFGAIEASNSGSNFHRLAPKITEAADEAMFNVLHQAQLVSKFPEGLPSIQGRLDSSVATLKELGDRVEALVLRGPSFTEKLSRRSAADEVLEELRLEQSAFTELSTTQDEPEVRHLEH